MSAAPAAADPWTRGSARVGPVTLHWIEAGAGPLVLLLHGFPDCAQSWRHQLPALARAGFRAVAPFLRGYAPSDRPRAVAAYRLDVLADDVVGLVRALGAPRAAAVVGHDWGGAIAWRLAAREPAIAQRIVAVNSPHPAILARMLRSPRQLVRSSYMGFFQLPWLPERLLRANDFALVRRSVAREVRRPGAFDARQWAWQRDALAPPGALRGALNYYRAAGRAMLAGRREPRAGDAPAAVPTLLLWGDRDRFLRRELADAHGPWAADLTVRRFPAAGHWVHWDEPEAVSAALVEFLRRG